MATPAQIAANQANAQRSTGPRTEEGKSKSRKNATRHGFCGAIPCMLDAEKEHVDVLLADLMDEHQPEGPTEQILVYKMAEQFYLTKRASIFLAGATRDRDTGQIALFLRYYNAADRAFNRNLNELRKLQKERRHNETEAVSEPPIGFVSQTASAPPPEVEPLPENPLPIPTVEPISVPSDPVEAGANVCATRKKAA
jgi:hypothetical protein